jgi:hypothetical protein
MGPPSGFLELSCGLRDNAFKTASPRTLAAVRTGTFGGEPTAADTEKEGLLRQPLEDLKEARPGAAGPP